MKKSLFIILFSLLTIFMVTGCGEESSNGNVNNEGNTGGNGHTGNGGDSGNGGNSGNGDNTDNPDNAEITIGSIWAGNWEIGFNTSVAVKIKANEIVTDYCDEKLAISNVTNEWGPAVTYSYKKEGNKYVITGITNGKADRMYLQEFYLENDRLILKDQRGVVLGKLTLKSTANDDEQKEYIINEINKYRQEQGFGIIPYNGNTIGGCAKDVADIRATEIDDLFGHTRPDGRPLKTVFDEATYCKNNKPSDYGEIIADASSAEEAMKKWKESAGHASTMIKDWTYAAVGKNGRYYVVFFTK